MPTPTLTHRLDPVHEVEFILSTYSGPALHLFRMWLARILDTPAYQLDGKTGSVERAVQRVQRMLRSHPEADLKREAIRKLLGLT